VSERPPSAKRRVFPQLWGPSADYGVLDWEPFREGVDIFPLYGERGHSAAAALLRYREGASVPQHRHSDWEHILVLAGSQADANGEYAAGTLVLNHPESTHSVASRSGCVVLAIWTGPVVILEGEEHAERSD
jgi:anti-sigma factor ChrR (cupin superfamily)